MGYFLFSLDTELAWGNYDHFQPEIFSPDGQQQRCAINRLLDILDEFNIAATWAIVGHLFYERCEDCTICPVLDWKGKYPSFDHIYKAKNPLWYGADVIETLLNRGDQHEIAFHGYTHKLFDENTMSEGEARTEIQEWLRVSKRKLTIPRTVIFPRNKIGHLDLFKEYGFTSYRDDELVPNLCLLPLIGRVFRRLYFTYICALIIPQVYEFKIGPSGLVNFPGSRYFFALNRKVELILDAFNLHKLIIRRIIKGIEKAATENKIIHIWAHPHDFQTEKDFEKLRYLFDSVSKHVKQGNLQSLTMGDLARKAYATELNRTGK